MADKEKYRVLMINDVYTPMEFVVEIMERFFGKTYLEATRSRAAGFAESSTTTKRKPRLQK